MRELLKLIQVYDFGLYNVPNGLAIADPLDNEEGFYLVSDNPLELLKEFKNWLDT